MFLNSSDERESEGKFDHHKLQIAACALLVEIAKADDDFSEEEKARITDLMKNEFDKAIGMFEKSTYLYPNSANAFHSLGAAFKRKRDFKLAAENYKKAYDLADRYNHPRKEFFKKELKEIQKYTFNN